MRRKIIALLGLIFTILVIVVILSGSFDNNLIYRIIKNEGKSQEIVLATTTSLRDSGLLDHLLPEFKSDTKIRVKVIAVGTGRALQMGRDGEVDVILVHAKALEEEFVKEGHGTKRYDVMYNDFVLVGPKDDPLNLRDRSFNDIVQSFKIINDKQYRFISRGDDSGTHKKEISIWESAGIKPKGAYYISAGQASADVLKMADELGAYTLTDRATFLFLKDLFNIQVIVEDDRNLINQYGVIPIDPKKNDKINHDVAVQFASWLQLPKTQKMIGEYGMDKYDTPLFIPGSYNDQG